MIVIDKDNKNLVIPNGLGNINRDYQEGYEAGYQESFDEGKAEGRAEGLAEGKVIGIAEGKQIQKDLLETITITENGTYNKEDGYNQVVVDVPDLNGSYDNGYQAGKTDGYDEGYDVGKVDGYDSGYTAGEVEQKSKLTNITISENGTYTREDGYNEIVVDVPDTNGSYDEGYADGEAAGVENAGAIIAETARVLDITENGLYETQYSEPRLLTPITGKYPNGDNFYDYAYISKRGYNTNIYPSPTTKIEFWWRFDGVIEQPSNEGIIIGAHKWGLIDSIFKISFNFGATMMQASIYDAVINFSIPDNNWHHYIMSFEDGLIIDGEQIGKFGNNLTETSIYEPICINGYYGNNRLNADDFGVVIVDDTIFIPTADGFMNYTTNEYLPIVRNNDGSYTYTQVEPEYSTPTGNLIKTVNVNVQPKIDVAENGIIFGFSTFTKVPDFFDFSNLINAGSLFRSCSNLQTIPLINTSNVSNMDNMFANCSNLQTIPLINTSNVSNMNSMFANCNKLQTIPELDTSNVTDMSYMFSDCSNLTTISLINTSNVTTMYRMFYRCSKLQTIPELDTSNVTGMNYMFYEATKLISLPALNVSKLTNINYYFGTNNLENLTDVGGWIDLKINWNDDRGLTKCPNLTYQSCINILNGLYDFTGNGETPTSSQGQLKVHQNFIDLVGEEISIGVLKGWSISA